MMPIADKRQDSDAPDQPHHGLRVIAGRPIPARPAVESSSSLDPARIINGLKYHWLPFIFFGSLLGAGLGAAAWTLLPAKYTTYAVLHVASKDPANIVNNREDSGRTEFLTFLKSQASIIKSEPVLKPALTKTKIGSTETLQRYEDPVRWLEENLLIEFSENSEYVKISLSGDNPQELAEIINAIVKSYIDEVVQKDAADASRNIEKLEDIEKSFRGILENTRILVTKERTDKAKAADSAPVAPMNPGTLPGSAPAAVLPDAIKLTVAPTQFAQMRENLRTKEVELAAATDRVKQIDAKMLKLETIEVSSEDLDNALNHDENYLALVNASERAARHEKYLKEITIDRATNADYQAAVKHVAKSKAEAEDFKRKIKTKLNRMVIAQLRIELEKQRQPAKDLVDKFKLDVDSLKAELAVVTITKEAANKTIADPNVSANDTTFEQMSGVYARLLQRINILKIAIQTPSRVNVIQKASVPIKKEMKKQVLGTVFGGLLGFAIVGGLITMYEGRVMRVFSSKELASNSNVNMIGILPQITSNGMQTKNDSDPFMEAVDQVRLMLSRNFLGKRAQTILVTSAESREGKTTLAGHLALSMTKTDRKTVIVDANLRGPALHEKFGLPQQPGVCELLRGDQGMTEAIQRTAIANLWFLAAGVYDANAQQAVGRDRFRRVIEKLRQEFDTIIIDSHSVLDVADTLLMGQHCDAVVVCARRYASRQPLVQEAYQRVAELGVPHCGMIFMGESTR